MYTVFLEALRQQRSSPDKALLDSSGHQNETESRLPVQSVQGCITTQGYDAAFSTVSSVSMPNQLSLMKLKV